jgi:hypothetical protein
MQQEQKPRLPSALQKNLETLLTVAATAITLS